MTSSSNTLTARGLRWAWYGEIALGLYALWYLLVGRTPRTLVIGFIVAGFFGLVSAHRLWRGQSEFGPEARKLVRRGVFEFLLAGLLFLLAFLSFQTFPNTTTGLGIDANNTTTGPLAHRFRDLLPPVFLLSAAIAVEALSGATILWPWFVDRVKTAVAAYAAFGFAFALALLWYGVKYVRDLEASVGLQAVDTAQANYYYNRFLDDMLPVFARGLLLSRVVAWGLLNLARQRVLRAELVEVEAEPSTPVQPQQPS